MPCHASLLVCTFAVKSTVGTSAAETVNAVLTAKAESYGFLKFFIVGLVYRYRFIKK